MNNEKLMEVMNLYEHRLWELSSNADKEGLFLPIKLSHLLTMIPKVREFIIEGSREKAFRWLGFIQGVLWTEDIYSIDEMRAHNMPPEETFDAKA